MGRKRFLSTILVALGAVFLGWCLQGKTRRVRVPERTRLHLVEREGRPWLHWESPEASGVVFQMEASSRLETIGVAPEPAHEHVVELAGWLGAGPVRVRVRPDRGPAPPPLELAPEQVLPYLDRLAAAILSGRSPDAWSRLGRFSELYLSSGRGELSLKTRLQAFLVERRHEAGPGGATWLWNDTHRPRRLPGIPGAPLLAGTGAEPQSAGPGDEGMVFELPPVPSQLVELAVRVELSPTPAPDVHLMATLSSGWKALLEPGPEGGQAFQRLDARALEPGGTRGTLTVHAGPEAPEGVRVSLLEVGVRYLPGEGPDRAHP